MYFNGRLALSAQIGDWVVSCHSYYSISGTALNNAIKISFMYLKLQIYRSANCIIFWFSWLIRWALCSIAGRWIYNRSLWRFWFLFLAGEAQGLNINLTPCLLGTHVLRSAPVLKGMAEIVPMEKIQDYRRQWTFHACLGQNEFLLCHSR